MALFSQLFANFLKVLSKIFIEYFLFFFCFCTFFLRSTFIRFLSNYFYIHFQIVQSILSKISYIVTPVSISYLQVWKSQLVPNGEFNKDQVSLMALCKVNLKFLNIVQHRAFFHDLIPSPRHQMSTRCRRKEHLNYSFQWKKLKEPFRTNNAKTSFDLYFWLPILIFFLT